MKIILWLGELAMLLATITAADLSRLLISDVNVGSSPAYGVAAALGTVGLILMLTGGLGIVITRADRPWYIWAVPIILGLLYTVSFFGDVQSWPSRIRDKQFSFLLGEISFAVIPGLIAVIEGVLLKRKKTWKQDGITIV